MKPLFTILLFLSAISATSAQTTTPLKNNKTGETIGTTTFSGDRIYLRKTDGELIALIVIDADGTRTMYDSNGKVLDKIPGK